MMQKDELQYKREKKTYWHLFWSFFLINSALIHTMNNAFSDSIADAIIFILVLFAIISSMNFNALSAWRKLLTTMVLALGVFFFNYGYFKLNGPRDASWLTYGLMITVVAGHYFFARWLIRDANLKIFREKEKV